MATTTKATKATKATRTRDPDGIGTRDRIRNATSDLFRLHGYTGTGMKQIVARADAPFGSLYHFFPGGKEELADEVIRWSGGIYGELVGLIFDPASDVATATGDFFDAAAQHLADTDYVDACPIATIALEVASTSERLRHATADVFESWLTMLVDRFTEAGIPTDRSRELAVSTLAALEGAFILGRALRDPEPVRAAGRSMRTLVQIELDRG